MSTLTTSIYGVDGMTCDHCVRAVTTEVGAIPGVREVRVDLTAGTVTVDSDQPLDTASVRAAVEEAGYEIR
jgi:copper ion binding protein